MKAADLMPLAQQPDYASAAAAINRLQARRTELQARVLVLGRKLAAPTEAAPGSFTGRVAALLAGERPADADQMRAEHLGLRQEVDAIDRTLQQGHAELRALAAEASAHALRTLTQRHLEIVRRGAAALALLIAAMQEEMELLAETSRLGYTVAPPTMLAMPYFGDPSDPEEPVRRHLRELQTYAG